MSILSRLASLFRGPPREPPRPEHAFAPELFVYVKIPEDVGPIDRGQKYEDPLQEALSARGLGEVTGGGSMLGELRPDGTQGIAFCGLDVDVTDLEPSLALLREVLPRLGAPAGTELHYTRGGAKLQDEYGAEGWKVGQPREMLHPGFGL